jgi:hypothetical protein
MHTYIRNRQNDGTYLYTVIFVTGQTAEGSGTLTLADFDAEWKAACYASWMNGGQIPVTALREKFPDVGWP